MPTYSYAPLSMVNSYQAHTLATPHYLSDLTTQLYWFSSNRMMRGIVVTQVRTSSQRGETYALDCKSFLHFPLQSRLNIIISSTHSLVLSAIVYVLARAGANPSCNSATLCTPTAESSFDMSTFDIGKYREDMCVVYWSIHTIHTLPPYTHYTHSPPLYTLHPLPVHSPL